MDVRYNIQPGSRRSIVALKQRETMGKILLIDDDAAFLKLLEDYVAEHYPVPPCLDLQ